MTATPARPRPLASAKIVSRSRSIAPSPLFMRVNLVAACQEN
jgi:hypothetical protein